MSQGIGHSRSEVASAPLERALNSPSWQDSNLSRSGRVGRRLVSHICALIPSLIMYNMLQKSGRRVEVKGVVGCACSSSFHPATCLVGWLLRLLLCRLRICWMLTTFHSIDWLPLPRGRVSEQEICYCRMVIEECWIPKKKKKIEKKSRDNHMGHFYKIKINLEIERLDEDLK